MQQHLQSPPTIPSSTAANFHLPTSPPHFIFYLTAPTIPTSTPFLYTSAIFHRLIFTHSHPYNPY